jgi:prepilin-type processing-associated H-X9-DG protein
MMTYFKYRNSVARIPDGTSNTIMFAENAGGLTDPGDAVFTGATWFNFSWGGGVWWSAYGVCPTSGDAGPRCGQVVSGPATINPSALGLYGLAASSMHAGGIVNMAFGDGSVHGINAGAIDYLSLRYLTGIKDGMVQASDF